MAKKSPAPAIEATLEALHGEDQAKVDYIFSDVAPLLPKLPDVAAAVPLPWSTIARRRSSASPVTGPGATGGSTPAATGAATEGAGRRRASLAQESTGSVGVPEPYPAPALVAGMTVLYASWSALVREVRDEGRTLVLVLENGAVVHAPLSEVRLP